VSFSLLAPYVPNVAKSIWSQCKYILTTDQRLISHLGKVQMAISPWGVIRSTSCLLLRCAFWGQWIEWLYFRFDQIQDGGSATILENSNGDISSMDQLIHSVFGSRVGFSGSADRMALFRVGPKLIGTSSKYPSSGRSKFVGDLFIALCARSIVSAPRASVCRIYRASRSGNKAR